MADQLMRVQAGDALFYLIKEVVRPHIGIRQQWSALGKWIRSLASPWFEQ
jgi:hypothetical protein